jgi:pimeloyl-ACP methyl ester carboxylesterase
LKTIAVTTEQGKFHAHLLGDKGEWVLCWPAQLTDHKSYLGFAQILARDHRVILIDPPAIGANQHLPYSDDLKRMVYFAQRTLSHLHVEQCHWVGHSAGGVVGVALRVAAPSRILSLTLACAPMLSQGRFRLTAAAAKAMLTGSRWGRRLLAARGVVQVGFHDEKEKNLVSQYLQDLFERTPPKTISNMRTLDSHIVRGVFDKLRADPPPMLVLCGRHDPVVLLRDQRTVAEITHAQFVDLPCGHMNLLAQPEASAQAVLRLMQSAHKQAGARTIAA